MTYVNRTTLIEKIARRTRISKKPLRRRDVELVLDLFLEFLAEELGKPDGRVSLKGLGILEVQQFQVGGTLKDITTGEAINIDEAPRYRVRFKSSKHLKQALRNSYSSEVDVSSIE